MYRTHYRQVDLSAIRDNIRAIRQAVPQSARVMAVVKADAYGHGIVPVAQAALASGASWLAVAIAEEGELLRQAGIEAPILVLGPVTPGQAVPLVKHRLTATLCDSHMVTWLAKACDETGMTVSAHLKVDTGMSRIGVRTLEEREEVLAALKTSPQVRLTGAFTHFADADGEIEAFTRQQFQRFLKLTDGLGVMRHCANSAALSRFPEMSLDMVRAGISLYGCPPYPTAIALRPAMKWVTAVSYVKTVDPGDTISYGRTFTADRPLRVATLPVGYGDGYHQAVSGHGGYVLIHGQPAPILGRVCMDQMMVDVSHLDDVQAGDEAVLMGTQQNETITADQLASWAGTISYEILLAATQRVPRFYVCE